MVSISPHLGGDTGLVQCLEMVHGPSPLAGPCTDLGTHGVFAPGLPEARGVWLCINTAKHIPTLPKEQGRQCLVKLA